MPPEPPSSATRDETRAWLTKAAHDLRAADHLAMVEPPLLDVAVYHCQQAVEKALKGFLTFHQSPFARTHSLVPLVEQAMETDSALETLLDSAEFLSPFAWRFRYPGEVLDPGEAEAREALLHSRSACRQLFERLPVDTQPTGWDPAV